MVGAEEHDLRLGLQVASGLQFDLRQMALAVAAGPRRSATWEEATHILYLLPLVSTEGKLGVWTARDLGHFIACLLICACKGEV